MRGRLRVELATVGLAWVAMSGRTLGAQVDTVRIERATLDPVLALSGRCRPQRPALWREPARSIQAGRGVLLRDGRAVFHDLDTKRLRLFDKNGQETGQLGGQGAGPGEFSPFGVPWAWAGDTLAVADLQTARISLFTGSGFAGDISLGTISPLASGGLLGRFGDGSLLFGVGLSPAERPERAGAFRGEITVVRWQPGSRTLDTLATRVKGPEWYAATFNGRPGVTVANFGRRGSAGVLDSVVVSYDNATPHVAVLDRTGRPIRVLSLGVADPPVSAADRDSLLENRAALSRGRPVPRQVQEALANFPESRPAALWHGTDAEQGLWLAFHPPVARGTVAFVRFTATGRVTHCFRPGPASRVVALGRDRAMTVVSEADGDLVTMEPTIALTPP